MQEVEEKIKIALEEVIKNDGYLLDVNVNERSLTHRLAIYLEKLFPDYHVDCEYNRDGIYSKKLNKKNTTSADTNAVTVYPDIIIHKRGTKDNLVVIEAKKEFKKSTSTKIYESDIDKIKAYKSDIVKLRDYKKDKDLGYKYAFFIRFPVSKNFANIDSDYIDSLIVEITDASA